MSSSLSIQNLIPAKKSRIFNEKLYIEVLSFLDSHSLQKTRFASKQLNSIIEQHLSDIARPHIEMVQIRWNQKAFFCRCLPSHGTARQYNANSMIDAITWLEPLIRNCFIRLFNLQNLELDEDALNALEKVRQCKLVQLSFVNVSMRNSDPIKLEHLIKNQLRATRYYFGRITNVPENQFFDYMLRSEAFLSIEKIEIDIISYVDRAHSAFTDDAIIEWYFKAKPILGYAAMIIHNVKLKEDFLERLFMEFQTQTKPKTISLVLCGQCTQRTKNFEEFISIKNEVSTCALVNLVTKEELEVEAMDPNRLEIVRRALKKDAQLDKNYRKIHTN